RLRRIRCSRQSCTRKANAPADPTGELTSKACAKAVLIVGLIYAALASKLRIIVAQESEPGAQASRDFIRKAERKHIRCAAHSGVNAAKKVVPVVRRWFCRCSGRP